MGNKFINILIVFILACELAAGLFAIAYFRQPMGFALISCAILAGAYLFYKGSSKSKER